MSWPDLQHTLPLAAGSSVDIQKSQIRIKINVLNAVGPSSNQTFDDRPRVKHTCHILSMGQ